MAIYGTNHEVTWLDGNGQTIPGNLYIRKLVWTGAATAGDDIKVMDAASNVQILVAKTTANGVVEIDFDGKGFFSRGIKLTTIDSGQLGVFRV